MKAIQLRPKPTPRPGGDEIALFCRQCCQLFRTPRIVAVCPLCARHGHPIEVGGELSGT